MSKFAQKLNHVICASLLKDKTKKSSIKHSNILYFRNKKSNPVSKLSNYNNLIYNNIINPTSKTVINPYTDTSNQHKKIQSNIDNKNITKYISKYLNSASLCDNISTNPKIDTRNKINKSKYIPKPNRINNSYSKNKNSILSFRKTSHSVANIIKLIEHSEINSKSMLNTSSSSKSVKNIKLSHKLNNARVENKIIRQIELMKGQNKEIKTKNILINKPPRTLNTDVCKFNSKEYCSLLPTTRIINSHRIIKNFENKNFNNVLINFDDIKSNDNFYKANKSCNFNKNLNFVCPNNHHKVGKKNHSLFNYIGFRNNKPLSIFDKSNNRTFYVKGNFFEYNRKKYISSNNKFY